MIVGMLPWIAELAGRMHEHVISSELLRGNPLGDPHERPLLVYTPPGYDDSPDRAYPAVYVIQGYTGHVAMWRNRAAFRQPFPETADAMFARGDAPPAVVVYVDAWTAYGGSQFVDSPGTGRYHSYLCDEVVRYVDAQVPDDPRRRPPRDHRQVQRRLRRHDHADAAARPVRRAGDARGRRALRVLLHPGVPRRRPAPAEVRRGHLPVVGRLPVPGVVHAAGGHAPGRAARRRRLLLRRATTAPPSCRSTRSPGCCGRTCGSGGWTGTRCGWCRATPTPCAGSGASGSTPGPGTISTSTSARRPSGRRCSTRESRTELIRYELFDATHAGIDYRYPLSLAWLCQRMAD